MRFYRRFGDLKGWKRFGFEVAIIAVGLGITLIAQELISNANRGRDTRTAMDAVEVELVLMLANATERLAIEPCRREQILTLAKRLETPGEVWTAEVAGNLNQSLDMLVLPVVVRTPFRPMPFSSWRALLASDAATGLDRKVFATLNSIYDFADDSRVAQNDAWRLKGRLSHLAVSGPLSDEQRREARATLGELAAIDGMIEINSRNQRERLLTLEFYNGQRFNSAFGSNDPEAALKSYVTTTRGVYGPCLDDAAYQPLFDNYNAATGRKLAIPARAPTNPQDP